jgi:biotin transporter BioY
MAAYHEKKEVVKMFYLALVGTIVVVLVGGYDLVLCFSSSEAMKITPIVFRLIRFLPIAIVLLVVKSVTYIWHKCRLLPLWLFYGIGAIFKFAGKSVATLWAGKPA